MNLRLYVSKRDHMRDHPQSHYIRFAVVDLDRSQTYPTNFVCMLPQQTGGKCNPKSVFAKAFGNKGLELTKRLLTMALKAESDLEIKAEIKKRLKLLEPKPAAQVKCRVCGTFFEPERRRFKPRICQECTRKKAISKE